MKTHYRVGTHGSRLAVTQTLQTVDALALLHPGCTFELVHIKTTGDKITDVPLAAIGDKGLFVKEIEHALLDRSVDFGVHSMKDMPTRLPPGLCIGAVPSRRSPFDCLIMRQPGTLYTLPLNAALGTGSVRRRAQLAAIRSDLAFSELRGNLPTRLARLARGDMAATMLALAGLQRLDAVRGEASEGAEPQVVADGSTHHGWVVPMSVCVPAVGQGALCLECRENDHETRSALEPLHHGPSGDAVRAERRFLAVLQGGCQIPAGACALVEGDELALHAVLCSLDGRHAFREIRQGPRAEAEAMGETLAHRLLELRGSNTC